MWYIFGIIVYILAFILKLIYNLAYFVYLKLLPFLVYYVGFPLFIVGCLFGLAASGGVLITLIVAAIVYYLYFKKVYKVDPLKQMQKEESKKQTAMGQPMM